MPNMLPLLNAVSLLLLLSLPDVASSTTALQVSGTPSCSGAFSLDSYSLDCGGKECTFGQTVTVSGTISSSTELVSPVHVKSTACIMSMLCMTVLESSGEMCNNLSAKDGQACPAAGSYSFSTKYSLPGAEGSNWYYGYWIDINAYFTEESSGSVTECKVSVKAVKSTTQTAAFVSFAGVLLLTGLTALGIKRKRTVGLMGEDDETVDNSYSQPTSDFEMMKNPSCFPTELV